LHYGKKLVRLLLDFGVVNTMDDSCEQQVPSTSLCSQQLTTLATRWSLCSVFNSCCMMPSWTGGHI